MDDAKTANAMKILDGFALRENFDFISTVAETPYQANRRALVELVLHQNAEKGRQKLDETIIGIERWMNELEILKDAAEKVSIAASAAVRSA